MIQPKGFVALRDQKVNQQRGGHTKVHEISQGVQFRTKFGRALEHPRQAAIESIQYDGKDKCRQLQLRTGPQRPGV